MKTQKLNFKTIQTDSHMGRFNYRNKPNINLKMYVATCSAK